LFSPVFITPGEKRNPHPLLVGAEAKQSGTRPSEKRDRYAPAAADGVGHSPGFKLTPSIAGLAGAAQIGLAQLAEAMQNRPNVEGWWHN